MENGNCYKSRKGRKAIEKEFIITETFYGTRKLADLVAELIYSEYRKRIKKDENNSQFSQTS